MPTHTEITQSSNAPVRAAIQALGRPLKVVFISHSDVLGGASVVTNRLMNALRQEGVDVSMLVLTKIDDDPRVTLVGSRTGRTLKFLKERLRIALANGFNRKNLFKVSIANSGHTIHDHPLVQDADVIVLGWINQGLLTLEEIRRLGHLGKPIVWTMHDIWCASGICHHSFGCIRFMNQCGYCPLIDSKKYNDLSHKTWLRKKALYDSTPITYVAVSNWLADLCRGSELMRGRDLRVIHNAFPVDSFYTSRLYDARKLPIDYKRDIILMGAARLDDDVKGLDYAVAACNYIFDNHPEVARKSMVVFFGDIRDRERLDEVRLSHIWVGRISDPRMLRHLYASSKVVISSSLYETLPGTLIEGQAAGCLPVTFGTGGQADIVEHMRTGYIARYRDSEDLARGILWALSQNIDREMLHNLVKERFSSTRIAARYLDLFDELLSRDKKEKDAPDKR